MEAIKLLIIHAFANGQTGGNPAGLVLNADNLSPVEKQEIARQAGLSETAFVSQSKVADLKLEFFTPIRQIPHCGHATIATFSYLKKTGRITGNTSSKETIDGIRQIFFTDDQAFMEQRAPTFQSITDAHCQTMLHALGLTFKDLLSGHRPEIVNTGNSFLIIPLRRTELLQSLRYDPEMVKQLSEYYDLIGFYPFVLSPEPDKAASTRMFAPYFGIPEESATGMAAGPLAAYLDRYRLTDKHTLLIEQGRFMQPPSPSRILVRLEKEQDKIRRLFAGGSAYVAGERTLHFTTVC